jgi:general secretion pathway protein A
MTRRLARLGDMQNGDRLQRLERSLLRLEHINLQTLSMLEKLVHAMKPADEEDGE